jgi:hypothetical protein
MAASAMAAALTAGAAAAAPSEAQLREAFAAADVNDDGVVDVDEYVAYFAAAFRRMDSSGKGYLTLDQFSNPDAARFASADRNDDGRISMGEAIAERMIVFFDIASNDGSITLDELLAYESTQ